MTKSNALTLINPKSGSLAFKIFNFDDNSHFDHIQRLNYYSLIWIQHGKGKVKADFAEYSFGLNTLFAFAPYQPFMIHEDENISGLVLNFHPDFSAFTNTIKKWLATGFCSITYMIHHL